MPFAFLFQLLAPLLVAAIKALLPWLIDKITADIKAGRPVSVPTESEIRAAMNSRKEAIRAAYRGQ